MLPQNGDAFSYDEEPSMNGNLGDFSDAALLEGVTLEERLTISMREVHKVIRNEALKIPGMSTVALDLFDTEATRIIGLLEEGKIDVTLVIAQIYLTGSLHLSIYLARSKDGI